MESLKPVKKQIRIEAQAARAAAFAADPLAGEKIRDLFLENFSGIEDNAVISGTIAIGTEIDTMPLLVALHAQRHPLCLPVADYEHDTPLKFYAYKPGDTLREGLMGTRVPNHDQPAMTPRVLLCPLLAFDREGGRLGYGGGYYDATLGELRRRGPVLTIGICFAAQEITQFSQQFTAVPMSPKDQRLDAILTEKEVIRVPALQPA